MHILIAPQEFKGSLSADEAADAIARGIRRVRPQWTLDPLPMSDGGPGLLEAMRRAVRSDTLAVVVHDALGRRVLARYLLVRESHEVVIEAAQANGLMHLADAERDPLRADTAGVGEILRDAATLAPPRILVGVGGSGTTDGGAGMARALGARFFDTDGRELSPGGGPLASLARIEWQPPAWLSATEVVVATDVTNPLVGPTGAAAVFAPQKGADQAQVATLEAGLLRYAEVVHATFGVDLRSLPGAGAAGGLAGGLVAFLGATIASGFDVVAEASHLFRRLARASVIITGEGSFDSQSLHGKVTGRLQALASEAAIPVVLFAGRSQTSAPDIHTLLEVEPDPVAAMRNASQLLSRVAQSWALTLPE